MRIELGREVRPGIWEWHFLHDHVVVEGASRQPLLDACRKLKLMGKNQEEEIGLFWPEQKEWALKTTIRVGAGLTVREPASGKIRGFGKFIPNQRWSEDD